MEIETGMVFSYKYKNHVMMECDHDILKNIQDYYISQIVTKKICNGQFTFRFIFQILHFMYIDMNIVDLPLRCCNMD